MSHAHGTSCDGKSLEEAEVPLIIVHEQLEHRQWLPKQARALVMSENLNRRSFITQAVLAGTAAAVQTAPAAETSTAGANKPKVDPALKPAMPTGKIGKLVVSRLISGGNLISGWAHSRDLQYVPALMRNYNTDEKVMDTLELLEMHGVNTIIADPSEKPFRIFAKYWKERGGKIQWIAEGHPQDDDWKTDIQKSIDFGASAIYVQGVIGDRWWRQKRLELLGKCVDLVKSQGLPGGIGAHMIDVIVESEKASYGADFYVKTHHSTNYWSKRRPDQNEDVIDNTADNYWDMDPARTASVMQTVKKPWVAFKVLAAGAIRPETGFRFALENGADFLCVGMFDFQVAQNTKLIRDLLPYFKDRPRAWVA